MQIGGREFQIFGHTYVMGILNVTPDSFSDGGRWNELDSALRRAEEMVDQGADIIDVGGESTRPGYEPLSAEEEIDRVIPVIRGIRERFDIPVSLDTHKADVAAAGIQAGVNLVNDVWGLKYDNKIARVISEGGVPCCLMHNRNSADYTDFMGEVRSDLEGSLRLAEEAGIAGDRIILDPGVGFAKSYRQNLEVINRLDELKQLGYPLLLGCSRKSVIGTALDLPVGQRLEGTLAVTVFAVMKGCMFVRVHDVRENARVIRMAEEILKGGGD